MSTYKVTKRCILWSVVDYSTWREELEFVLLSWNLWDITFSQTEEGDEDDEETLEDKVKKQQAAGYINLCLNMQFHPICTSTNKDPKAMMAVLDAQLKPKTAGYCIIYLCWFMRMWHEPGETLDAYFRRLDKVVKDLEGQGYTAEDDLTMAVMLDGLLPKYKSAQTFIKSSKNITYMQAKQILIQWEATLAAKEATSDAVNYANSKGRHRHGKGAVTGG